MNREELFKDHGAEHATSIPGRRPIAMMDFNLTIPGMK